MSKKQNAEDYEKDVWEAFPVDDLTWNALGLCSEAGEFGNMVKKMRYNPPGLASSGSPPVVNSENLAYKLSVETLYDLTNELGDVLWHVAQCCHIIGVSMEAVMKCNLVKTRTRNGK